MQRSELILYLDDKICAMRNNLYRTKFLLKSSEKKLLKKNFDLKGKHEGEVCFILGNGPSLLEIKTKELKQYNTFSVNYFYNGDLGFDSNYHVMIDPVFAGREFGYFAKLIKDKKNTKFIVSTDICRNKDFADLGTEKDNVYFVNLDLKTHMDYFSYDMTKQMTVSLNVLPFTIQCAIYMGYKKIYLLGCDFGLYGNRPQGYFYRPATGDEKVEPTDCADNVIKGALVQRHFLALAHYCREHQITIKNLTRYSYIRAYPFDTFENVMNELKA